MEPMSSGRNGHALAHVVAAWALVNVLIAMLAGGGALAEPSKPMRIVAFGDSLSSGYGLKPGHSFPAQLQKALKARGHNVVVTNAGVAGDTTAAGLARLAWSVPKDADAIIVEFGANDALRGIDPKETRANLQKMIAALKARGIPVLLAGMRSPANWGDGYTDEFDAIFPELAREQGLILYPFFLDGVVLDSRLNLDDGMHPNRRGVAEIVKRITPSVEELIGRAASRRASATKS